MHYTVFLLLIRVEHIADAFPKAFFLHLLWHMDDSVFRHGGDYDFLFRFRGAVVVDGAVEFGQRVEVVELSRQLITDSTFTFNKIAYLINHQFVVFAYFKQFE